MKGTLTWEFDLPEETEDLIARLQAPKAIHVIHTITQDVFRPARKHGYSDAKINDLVQKLDDLAGEENEGGTELIGYLETMCYEIINENCIDLG